MSEIVKTPQQRRWTTPAVVAIAVASFAAGNLVPLASSSAADIEKGQPRSTFIDGGVLANDTLQQSLVVLKRLDERVGRIEEALLEVAK